MASGLEDAQGGCRGGDISAGSSGVAQLQPPLALSCGADLDDGEGLLMEEPLAWAFLRKVEVYGLSSPEVMLEADGDLCFDWAYLGRSVSISLSPTGRVCWAALVDGCKEQGCFQWPEWSEKLDGSLVRYNA